jgi:hypothetical protein
MSDLGYTEIINPPTPTDEEIERTIRAAQPAILENIETIDWPGYWEDQDELIEGIIEGAKIVRENGRTTDMISSWIFTASDGKERMFIVMGDDGDGCWDQALAYIRAVDAIPELGTMLGVLGGAIITRR